MRQNSSEDSSLFSRDPFIDAKQLGKKAGPNYQMLFPNDHFEHTEFDIEWWYLTANLVSEQNEIYGLQWTLFRFRNPSTEETNSEWGSDQLYMAHASIHSIDEHFFSEKYARRKLGNAGNNADPFTLFIDNWEWKNNIGTNNLLPASLTFDAVSESGKKIRASLNLSNNGPLVKHGEDGFSVKSPNGKHASHYYSAPFIHMTGLFEIQDKTSEDVSSFRVLGDAWYDHEWTSQLLDNDTLGWDWMSLHLDNGDKLMAFRMRLDNQNDFVTGSYISKDGALTTLSPNDISLLPITFTRVNGKDMPLAWQLSIESKNMDLSIESVKTDQWNHASIPYYEGMVSISGTQGGKGFLELTGY